MTNVKIQQLIDQIFQIWTHREKMRQVNFRTRKEEIGRIERKIISLCISMSVKLWAMLNKELLSLKIIWFPYPKETKWNKNARSRILTSNLIKAALKILLKPMDFRRALSAHLNLNALFKFLIWSPMKSTQLLPSRARRVNSKYNLPNSIILKIKLRK